MYKLFLCLRYLRSRAIAYFAVAGVALCVAMMLIVISVMNGFLDKIEAAAKGLFGDITIASTSLGGIGRYEEFIAELKDGERFGELAAATPFIFTYGILRVPETDYRKDVQLVGIRLPGPHGRGGPMDYYDDVSGFEKGLFVQEGLPRPTFDPPKALMLERLAEDMRRISEIAAAAPVSAATVAAARSARHFHDDARAVIEQEAFVRARLAAMEALNREAQASAGDGADLDRLGRRLEAELAALQQHFADFITVEGRYYGARRRSARSGGGAAGDVETLRDAVSAALRLLRTKVYQPPAFRTIIGRGIPGLIHRTPEGQTIRKIVPGSTIGVSLVPLGQKAVSATSITLTSEWFTVIDDCRTDVSSIDSQFVYLPFETLQELNRMGPEFDPADANRIVRPGRCSQILVKVRPEDADDASLLAVRRRIEEAWQDFHLRHPDAVELGGDVVVQTWREKQAQAIGPLERQRTLSVIMFGVISLVSVVLIFVMFYMIVVQKTRDIGVLKAVGASDAGVAGIFLAYGAAIGLVGSVIGTIGGAYFVRYINEVQDAVDRWFGFRVWQKEFFLFERIPNEVNPSTAAYIMIGAIVAGLIGALIPAARAARMQPVEALRYE